MQNATRILDKKVILRNLTFFFLNSKVIRFDIALNTRLMIFFYRDRQIFFNRKKVLFKAFSFISYIFTYVILKFILYILKVFYKFN